MEYDELGIEYDRRAVALLLKSPLHDFIANINPNAVEAVNWIRTEFKRCLRVRPDLLDGEVFQTAISNFLTLTSSANGQRSEQVVKAISALMDDDDGASRDLQAGGGLKHG